MEPNTDGVIITEKRRIPPQVKLIIASVFVLGTGLFGYVWYLNTVTVTDTPVLLESYGLVEPVLESDIPSGAVVYLAYIVDDEKTTTGPFVFRQSLSDDTSGTELPITVASYVSLDDGTALISGSDIGSEPNRILRVTESTGVVEELPVSISGSVKEMVVNHDTTAVAIVTHDVSNKPTLTIYNLSDWSVVTTVPGAKHPAATFDSEAVWWYQTNEGIFRLPVGSDTAILVSDLYTPFTESEEFSVTPDGRTLVMTVPTESLISVQDVRIDGAFEIGRLVTAGTSYTSPVVSADGQWYAVLANTDNTAVLEFRLLEQAIPVLTKELTDLQSDSIALLRWEDETQVFTGEGDE